ncbi:hypothetical protein IFR04_011905 [Cadophora malorum]|uniref:histidine kinase n=1 Tax=Cadophora malorum TaxID=108018 RepID=A0A8H7T9I0_9HELO|nr:hypothetical protein IFR04_011905 [Cadophora malorum]
MDHDNQYILAGATRSVSLHKLAETAPGDEIYLGPRVLDIMWGVCPSTIQVFTAKDGSLNIDTAQIKANPSSYVMNDLSQMESFKDRPYVAEWPFMKFYAEVPITSPTGHVIGAFCVVDDKPRDGLDDKGLKSLSEISSAIMKHLELVQMQNHFHRADKMLHGLGMFVEKRSIPEDLATRHGYNSLDLSQLSSLQPGMAHTVSSLSDKASGDPEMSFPTTVSAQQLPLHRASRKSNMSNRHTDIHQEREVTTTLSSGLGDSPSPRSRVSTNTFSPAAQLRGRGLTMRREGAFLEPLASEEMQQLFSCACYRIREGLELDGVILIDACFQDVDLDSGTSTGRSNTLSTPRTADSENNEWDAIQNSSQIARHSDSATSTKASNSDRALTTEVLGHSVLGSVLMQELPFAIRQIPLRRSTLHSLLQTFREGTVFAFDRNGRFLDSSDGNGNELSVVVSPERLKKWATELANACPGARSIMFFPLWDNHFDQWFAGVLAYYARIIHPPDINYLAAFASCIMSEKSRLDVGAAEREKMDFISSVSHELRSPLHGVLASSEALQETSTGPLQDDMIHVLLIPARSFNFTDEGGLDYAVTSRSLLPRKLYSKSKSGTPTYGSTMKKTKPLDLSEIIESTMESVYYGHDFHKSTFATFEDTKASQSRPIDPTSTNSQVMLILNIAKEDSWIFKSQVSAWTRILMNLFGNALKYTKRGFVNVTLRRQLSPTSKPSASHLITLQVEDSGKGMSENYLKYNVFTPFVQEDQMAVGTGLGLSIVRQLVRDLGGHIDIQSEIRLGTKVTVSVPLHSPSAATADGSFNSENLLLDVKSRTKGLRLCLVDFDYYPDEEPTGILSAHAKSMLALKQSLTSMAADWFEMEVITSPDLASATGDVLLGLRSKLNLLEEHTSSIPLIVFEDTTESRLLSTKGVQYLSMPAGPHKFAHSLKVCLDTKLSGLASTAASAKIQNTSVSEDQTPPDAETPTLVPKVTRTSMSESLQAPSPTPTFHEPRAQHTVRLKDVSRRLVEEQEQLVASRESHSPSSITTSISPIPSPVRNKVLLVEDNAVNLKILMHCMRSAKQEYVTAMNGLEALEHYQATPDIFKAIFMDLSMPIMDGLTSTRHIRAYEEEQFLPRTRIVALTCFSSEKYQRDASASGVDLYIVKPVPMKALRPILALDPDDFTHTDDGLRTPNSIDFGSPLRKMSFDINQQEVPEQTK